MYNKQIFAQYHLTMPLHATWGQIAQFAKELNDPARGTTGILLRGQSGWGMNMIPLAGQSLCADRGLYSDEPNHLVKVFALATMIILVPVAIGMYVQRHLVQGLSGGALK